MDGTPCKTTTNRTSVVHGAALFAALFVAVTFTLMSAHAQTSPVMHEIEFSEGATFADRAREGGPAGLNGTMHDITFSEPISIVDDGTRRPAGLTGMGHEIAFDESVPVVDDGTRGINGLTGMGLGIAFDESVPIVDSATERPAGLTGTGHEIAFDEPVPVADDARRLGPAGLTGTGHEIAFDEPVPVADDAGERPDGLTGRIHRVAFDEPVLVVDDAGERPDGLTGRIHRVASSEPIPIVDSITKLDSPAGIIHEITVSESVQIVDGVPGLERPPATFTPTPTDAPVVSDDMMTSASSAAKAGGLDMPGISDTGSRTCSPGCRVVIMGEDGHFWMERIQGIPILIEPMDKPAFSEDVEELRPMPPAPQNGPGPILTPQPRGGGGGGGGGGGSIVGGASLGYDVRFDFSSEGEGVLSGSSIRIAPGNILVVQPLLTPAGLLTIFDMEIFLTGAGGESASIYYNRLGAFFGLECVGEATESGMMRTCDESSIISGAATPVVVGGSLESVSIPLEDEFAGSVSIMLRDNQGLTLATHDRDRFALNAGGAAVPGTAAPGTGPDVEEPRTEPVPRDEPEPIQDREAPEEPAAVPADEPRAEPQQDRDAPEDRQDSEPAAEPAGDSEKGFFEAIGDFFRSLFGLN
ncbi:hypothetical protein CENSYa_1517 [Cenarchaeum symbiosum A]|uniref:Uncharacterized protein n=1 Tax=Cenarchaeum symbiosum (strain A) TaxID=414004 RepID=A0RXS2_CENSY|nr:hypothetical protein CENSYa_1517 [Cenarchaeum symbiosum A]